MARNKAGEDLLAQLEQLGAENTTTAEHSGPVVQPGTVTSAEDEDVLADLQAQLAVKPATSSRPTTPRISSSNTSATTKSKPEHTPASSGPPSQRNSEDRLRNSGATQRSSGEGRSYHQSTTPGPEEQEKQVEVSGGGSWWGSVYSAASAAVKQAETLAKEIGSNEEAQRWAQQVTGSLKELQTLSTDLSSRALPTFTSLISHIAPPISAHERLQIHITHDIQNYPSLDPLIYSTFSRVMQQVEGGDLIVLQRGSESRNRTRRSSEPQGYRGGVLGSGNGWTDGPWWRDDHLKRSLGAVPGLKEGTRLARVSAESYAKDFFDARGGVEAAAKLATETLSESNPVRSSEIFLAIQAVSYPGGDAQELFAEDVRAEKSPSVVEPVEDPAATELVVFALYLHDPLHSLSFSALSQPFPQKWAVWLDASPRQGEVLPESILEIIESGGVDPREWIAEWMEEILALGVGVLAQQYVARRMGVGEGGLGRGKRRAEEDGVGGEAARAL